MLLLKLAVIGRNEVLKLIIGSLGFASQRIVTSCLFATVYVIWILLQHSLEPDKVNHDCPTHHTFQPLFGSCTQVWHNKQDRTSRPGPSVHSLPDLLGIFLNMPRFLASCLTTCHLQEGLQLFVWLYLVGSLTCVAFVIQFLIWAQQQTLHLEQAPICIVHAARYNLLTFYKSFSLTVAVLGVSLP